MVPSWRSIASALGTALLALTCPMSAQAETVRVAIVRTITDAPIYIADAKGYFKDEGLEVEMQTFDSGAKMAAPLGTGDLDVGAGGASVGLYNAVEHGVGIKMVADKAHYDVDYGFASILVRKDLVASGRFKSYGDLKGLKVATVALGSSDDSVVNEALKRGGLKWGDAQIVYLGFPLHAAALANGAVDVAFVAEPFVTYILRAGDAVRFVSDEEFYPHQQTATLLYGAPFIEKRHETALRFMRAYIRGIRLYNDALAGGRIAGPAADDVIAILTAYSLVKDPAIFRAITPHAADPDGRLNLDGLRKDWQFFKDTGQIDGKVTVDDVVDTSFARTAVAALGPYRPAAEKK